jgi:hypothetical protein
MIALVLFRRRGISSCSPECGGSGDRNRRKDGKVAEKTPPVRTEGLDRMTCRSDGLSLRRLFGVFSVFSAVPVAASQTQPVKLEE